jgi:hypothetical protein
MLSVGLTVAAWFDGDEFIEADGSLTFYQELRPISSNYERSALAVAGLDRDRLEVEGTDPSHAMSLAREWVHRVAGDDNPVLVGFPLIFDWMFIYWYFEKFTDGSPFEFSSGLDMKTMYQQKARILLSEAGKDDLPDFLKSARRHTHNALDDALEQADIFRNLFQWEP